MSRLDPAQQQQINDYRALEPHSEADLQIGKPAPEILGVTYDGQFLRLSDFKGKVLVLDFWGDW